MLIRCQFYSFYRFHRDVERIGVFYKLHIRVSDGKFSKVAYVNINVETSENSGLIFQKPIYDGSIVENSTKITTVTVVNVIGSTLNEHVEFKLLNPTDMFKIGLTSGAIETTGKRFDRETRDNYELIVEARSHPPDREKPRVAHVVVNITIIDGKWLLIDNVAWLLQFYKTILPPFRI